MSKLSFPLGPMIIGFILGPMAETNLRRGLMAVDGNIFAFFQKPIALAFFAATILSIVFTVVQNKKVRMRIENDKE